MAAAVLVVALTPARATAGGRLLETGHDADWRCAVSGTECHFLQVAVSYVRNGAPDPSKKLLVVDTGNLQLRESLINAFGAGIANQMDVVAPTSQEYQDAVLSPAVYSAMIVASDETCGYDGTGFQHGDMNTPSSYCDLNRPDTGWPPATPGSPQSLADSDAIDARADAIKSFFDAGGGVLVLSGADNGDGHSGDRYYAFLDRPGGAAGSACEPDAGLCLGGTLANGLALTPAGRQIGFTDGTGGTPNDITCGLDGGGCATHNSFLPPRLGSQLHVAETGPDTFDSTLFADTNPPDTVLTGGPGATIPVAAPAPPYPVVDGGAATVTFRASEDTTTFSCAVDGGPAGACSSPFAAAGLAPGVHKIDVSSTDAAGNVDATPAELTFLVARDADHDGYLDTNPFGPHDCNDANAAINPAAAEIPGNRVDENCDQNIAGFSRVRPTYGVGASTLNCRRCVRLKKLVVADLPAGARVRVRCSGRRCHVNRVIGTAARDGAAINALPPLKHKKLRPKTVVELIVTAPQQIGSVKRLKVRRTKRGAIVVKDSSLCLEPGARKPTATCAEIQ